MESVRFVIRQAVGLFVDDEFLAVATLAVVGVVALIVHAVPRHATAAGGILLAGCVMVLVLGVWRTTSLRLSAPARAGSNPQP